MTRSRRAGRPERALLPLLLLGLATAPAMAGEGWLLQGLFDGEAWKTDGGSAILSRNDDETAEGARLRLWTAGDLAPGVQGYALGYLTNGVTSYEGGGFDHGLEQAFVRVTPPGAARLRIQAGRSAYPVGEFSARYLSNVNPLIGVPDTYAVGYPEGIQVAGVTGRFDWMAAMIDRPLAREGWVPEAGKAYRPALQAGFTVIQGLRLAAFTTRGPYLGETSGADLPPGDGWRDYDQQVDGLDVQFSRGYLEVVGEFTISRYEVPEHTRASRGKAWYLEPKYTFTPRLFAALRIESNQYPYIAVLPGGGWLATEATVQDVEAGIGWRLAPGALVKASYRRDRWIIDDALRDALPAGHAVAIQMSYAFDVRDWVERPR